MSSSEFPLAHSCVYITYKNLKGYMLFCHTVSQGCIEISKDWVLYDSCLHNRGPIQELPTMKLSTNTFPTLLGSTPASLICHFVYLIEMSTQKMLFHILPSTST